MMNDLRFAFRMISTHRWFSAAIIVTLALGIGINTTVFTLVNAVLFKPVPIPGGDRIVTVRNRNLDSPNHGGGLSWPDYLQYKEKSRTFEGLEALNFAQEALSEAGNSPERYNMARVTPGMFTLFQIPPILGRGFGPADGRPGAEAVVLLGHGIWMNRYAGALDVIGRAIRVGGRPATVIGVMPEGFRFPREEDFWMALVPDPELEKPSNHGLTVFGLLKPGVSMTTAGGDMEAIAARLALERPDTNKDTGALVQTFHETYNGGKIRSVFLLMLGAVGFVLLIACANVANMMLSRGLARGREIAVRVALGATRWQIGRLLMVESLVLSFLGGGLGLGLSVFGVRQFDLATRDVGKPYWILFEMDWRAFSYFAGLCVLSGIIFGLVPALRASKVAPNSALKAGMPGGDRHRGRLAGGLVVFQFALTAVLVAGAGLMARSFVAAQELNSFARLQTLFSARIQLPENKERGDQYADPAARLRFWEKLLPELRVLPGVTDVAAVNNFPGMGSWDSEIEIEGRPTPDSKHPLRASILLQTPNYLSTIRLPVQRGRGFDDRDGMAGREAVVVSSSFAARHWPDGSALGRRCRIADTRNPKPWMTVVGICADMVQDPSEADPPPLIHVPMRQEPWGWMGLLMRVSSNPAGLTGPVRAAVQKIDPDLPVFEARPLTAALDRQHWFLGVFGTLFGVFAATGLVMASVGIYAVVAQTTARRTKEIGIRMALGSTAGRIARLVLSRGISQLAIGLAAGLVGAIGVTRLMGSVGLVTQVSPRDPGVFIATVALLFGIGAFACWLPARRASRIKPLEALRNE
jgi:predicted permease